MSTRNLSSKARIYLIIVFSSLVLSGIGQNTTESIFRQKEKELAQIAAELSTIRFNDKLADSLSIELLNAFDQTINTTGSFEYAFDSVFPIGKIETENKNVRVFTWSYVRENGTVKHFGYIQHYFKPQKRVLTYQLKDSSDVIIDLLNKSLNHNNWFGALYYDIIETETKTGSLYTLIGFDANNIYSTKKIIETLYFTSSGKPKFGKSVIKVGRKKQKRIIFEYSRMASMLIKWEPEMEMIVADHLSPVNNAYLGNFRFYGPDLSYDGFKYEDGNWVYYSDIDYKMEPTRSRQRRNSR